MHDSTVVVIEDNVDFATILQTVLKLWGYTVQHYDTLAAGWDGLCHTAPTMLILDGQLPDGDGYVLYYHLRQQPQTRNLPVLLLSVSDDVYEQARAASVEDPNLFVGLKPMPLEDIYAIVSRVAA